MSGDVQAAVRFQLLGPIAMQIGGRPVALGGAKPRTLLAALLAKPGRTVDTSTLIDVVWGEDPPTSARGLIQTYVSTIRRAMQEAGAPDLLVGEGAGYRIGGEFDLDAREFEAAVAAARVLIAEDRFEEAARSLRDALDLWHGPAFGGLGGSLLRAEAGRLDELRITALELRVGADLELGKEELLVPELRGLVAEHPLRERLWASLMLALGRTGQQSAALAVFETVRERLADQFGADPGPWLRQAHETVLRNEPHVPVRARAVPMQLPADLASFSGRSIDLAGLDELLPGPAVIVGPGGVGKTALAVRWAHRVRDRFPDGQLFIDLRGYDPASPVSSAQALTQCLRALGAPAQHVPATLDEQIALYRSLLADRRLLVVLDNAANAEQVRPLLPPNQGSMALITSRSDLRGLTVLNDASVWLLDVLSSRESRDLLIELVGAELVDAEPRSVGDLARLCGHLPLALRIAAANLIGGRHSSIADYVAALRDDRLAELVIEGDPSVAVRATFSLSYQALDADAQRLFRLLGRAAGLDFSLAAAGAVNGTSSTTTRRSLARLVAANLLLTQQASRFQFHDLIREYAADRARAEDFQADRDAADTRLFDHYLSTASAAVNVVYPGLRRLPLPDFPQLPAFDSEDAALRWLDDERANLVAVVERVAGSAEFCRYGGRIADTLRGYFQSRGHSADGLAMCSAAIEAARNAGDRSAEASALDLSGVICFHLSDYDQAIARHTLALSVSRQIGDLMASGESLHNLGRVYAQLGQPREAMRYHEEALTIAREVGSLETESRAINYIGVAYLSLGDVGEAIRRHEEALRISRRVGDRIATLLPLNGLGLAYWTAGQLTEAARCHRESLDICRALGLRHFVVTALVCLAEACSDLGEYQAAEFFARQAFAESQQSGERRHEAGALEIVATVQRRRGQILDSIL
ncbi:MAG: BTAD domain-containing putative transcriptional regulator, partial [Kibdelosporangium sp.]